MAARGGRGRGRGGQVGRQGEAQSTRERHPKSPSSMEELTKYLYSLNEGNFDKYGEMFANMVLGFSTDEMKLENAMSLVFDTTIESRDKALLGAKICAMVAEAPKNEPQPNMEKRNHFRKILLRRFQTEFKKKEETRQVSIEAWLSIFSFLCEVFRLIKVQGNPITVVGRAILTAMEWLLSVSDIDDDEVECIGSHLKTNGQSLEVTNKESLRNVIKLLRNRVVTRKSSCKTRCMILEVLEFRAMGWQDIDNELDQYYMDAISDAAVEDDLSQMKSNA